MPGRASQNRRAAVALSLTLVGGFADAVGYIALFHIFTANMSGNSVQVGIASGQASPGAIARPACAIASYVLGLVATRVGIEAAGRHGIQRIASVTLG